MTKQRRPERIIKLLLPVDLVREMDRAILGSDGVYQDRNEFVTEAIRDRLLEDAAGSDIGGGSGRGRELREETVAYAVPEPPVYRALEPAHVDPDLVRLGAWERGAVSTVPARPSPHMNFGLHNRDFPTIWAANRLATMAVGQPTPWDGFLAAVRSQGADLGGQLRMLDVTRPVRVAIGIGFPKPGAKKTTSIDRFVEAMIGSPKRDDGPLFSLALAGFADPERSQIAPTDAGLTTLEAMIAGGLGTDLPQPADAFAAWWSHLSEWAPVERGAWHKVLTVVAGRPNREELVNSFPEWPRSNADTNTTGFISRSREWGLVEPELIEGRYQLTDLGQQIALGGN